MLVAVVALSNAAEAAENYLWRPVAIGAGGFITGYSVDRSGATRVGRSDVYGAYLWRPEENRWAQLVNTSSMPKEVHRQNSANEGVFEIVVAPSNPDRIYMALKGAVYRSDNRGGGFVKTSLPGAAPSFDPNSEYRNYGPFIAVDPANPDMVFFGTPADGLFRSENAGADWTRVASVPVGTDRRSDQGRQSPGVIIWFESLRGMPTGRTWAMSPGNGLFVSSDAGKTFKPLPGNVQSRPSTLKQGDFAPDGSFFGVDPESRSVWRYRDGGWTNLTEKSTVLGFRGRRFSAVAVNPNNSQVLVFDEGGVPFRSNDGGESWFPLLHRAVISKGDPPYLRVNDTSYWAMSRVQFDPVVADRLWVAAGTGVYYADTRASAFQITWNSRLRGIEELVANDVVKPAGQAPLFAGWDYGVHRKVDLDAYSTTFGPKERVLISAQQLGWSASNPSMLVTNASDARTNCCSEDGDSVLAGYSLDAGKTWAKFAQLPHPPGTKPDDPWRMSFGAIAVSSGGIDNIIWAPTFHRSPFFTKDRGVSWTRISLPGEVLPFTGSHAALHYNRKTMVADRVEPGVFYYVHSGDGGSPRLKGLWVTRNGGSDWRKVFDDEIAPSSELSAKLRAVPGHAGHLFFTSGVYGIDDTRLRRSVDAGSTWSVVGKVDQVDDIGFGKAKAGSSYPTIFISGRVGGVYGIWRSTDAAARWSRIATFPIGSLDQVTVVEGDLDVFGRVYIGHQGSGWSYGNPSDCVPATYQFPAAAECSRTQSF